MAAWKMASAGKEASSNAPSDRKGAPGQPLEAPGRLELVGGAREDRGIHSSLRLESPRCFPILTEFSKSAFHTAEEISHYRL